MLTSAWLVCCEKYRAQPVLHTLLAKLQYASEGTNCRIELQIRKYCTRTTEKTIRAGETWRERYCSCYRVRRFRPKPKTISNSQLISCHPRPRIKPKAGRTVRFGCKVSYSARALARAAAVPVCRMFLSRKKGRRIFRRRTERERRRKAGGGERASVVALERKRRDSLTLQPAHLAAERYMATLQGLIQQRI